MRFFTALLLALVLAGCSRQVKAPDPAPPAAAPDPSPASAPAPAPVADAPPQAAPPGVTREAIPGGFRFSPLDAPSSPDWKGPDRLTVRYGSQVAEITLPDGSFTARAEAPYREPVAGGKAALYVENGTYMYQRDGEAPKPVGIAYNVEFSPDRTRLVTYGKTGPGQWVDLTTGETQQLDGPGYYASGVFDSWAPDSSLYLVQAFRDNPLPGFHFFGRDGKPAWTWHEPGYLSDWAFWSPDASKIAFLSTPLDLKYKMPPDAWDEPPMAPRLGVLDLKTRTAKYFQVDGQVAAGWPLWAPDGKQIALRFGPLQDRAGSPDVLRGQIYVVDVVSGNLRPVTPPPTEDALQDVRAWSPDSTALLINDTGLRLQTDGSAGVIYRRQFAVDIRSGQQALLPEYAKWVDKDRIVVADTNGTVTLVDRQGKDLQALGYGNLPVISPDGQWAAFVGLNRLDVVRLNN